MDHFSLLFSGHQQGPGSEVEQLGCTLTPIGDASVTGGSFAHFATVLLPKISFTDV